MRTMPSFVFFVLLSSLATVQVSGQSKYNATLLEKWARLEQVLPSIVWPPKDWIVTRANIAATKVRLSTACRDALALYGRDLKEGRQRAIKMLDSSGKVNSGWMKSEFMDMASYDQCMSLGGSDSSAPTKFCMATLHWPLPTNSDQVPAINLTGTSMEGTWLTQMASVYKVLYSEGFALGLCVPSICSRAELKDVMATVAGDLGVPIKPNLDTRCLESRLQPEKLATHPAKKLAAAVVLSLVVITLASTAMTYLHPRSAPRYAHFFCALSNTAAIFKDTTDKDAQRLSFLNGIRFLYMLMSLAGHWYIGMASNTPITHNNVLSVTLNGHPLHKLFFRTGALIVGFNFVIGGLLNYYSWLPELKKRNGRLNFPLFIVARFIRTTPLIAATILMVLAFPTSLGSGPAYEAYTTNITETCVNNGWRELAYISNMYEGSQACLPHSWYMSADFQLYIVSFFVLSLLYKRPRRGILAIGALIVIGILAQMGIMSYFDTARMWRFDTHDYNKIIKETHLLHFGAANYITSYFMGIFLGYLIAHKIEVQSRAVILAMKIACPILVVIAMTTPLLLDLDLPPLIQLMVSPLSRTLLSFAVGGIAYLCWLGEGGLMNTFLSWTFFARLGRFSFSTFMAHYLVIWYEVAILRHQMDFSVWAMISRIIATTTFSHIVGYAMFLVFEAPAFNIAKACLSKGKSQGKRQDTSN